MMMLQCWEAMPDKRPSFDVLYKNTSKYIEGIAGYLEIGMNPFAGQDYNETGKVNNVKIEEKIEGVEPVVNVQITPPSPDK